MAQIVKNPPSMQETRVQSLGPDDFLEKGLATHSSMLACLENPMDRGAWQTVVHGVTKLDTTEVTEHSHAPSKTQCHIDNLT